MINSVNSNCKEMFIYKNSSRHERKTGNIKQDITRASITQRELYSGRNVQDIYMSHLADRRYIEEAEPDMQTDRGDITAGKEFRSNSCYQGIPLEVWALTDPEYTDKDTGITWFIRDGRYPYLLGEDAEQFEKLCSGADKAVLEQLAEQTGIMRKLGDNTIAFVSGKGIGIKSVDGKELLMEMPDMPYDMLLGMLHGLPAEGNYFDLDYWKNTLLEADEECREMSSVVLNTERPAGSNESASDSDIIVKADGSRVLVITMKIGGMQTTMSLKLSEPTELQDNEAGNDESDGIDSEHWRSVNG